MVGEKLRITEKTRDYLLGLDRLYQAATSPEEARYAATEAVRRVGPLAPWFLTLEALEVAETLDQYRNLARDVPPVPGLCLPLFAWEGGLQDTPNGTGLLRAAVVIPVRWVRGKAHDPTLPGPLRQLADDVLEVLQTEGFALAWPDFVCGVDASELPCTANSAFITLAAALALARDAENAQPNPRIWCTGVWDAVHNEVDSVDGIEAKVQTCLSFGADRIFVPVENRREARKAVAALGRDPELVGELPVQSNINQVLRPVLALLRVEPPAGAAFEELEQYYHHLADYGRGDARTQFYLRRLVEPVAKRCIAQLDGELQAVRSKSPLLVTTLSFQPELVRLGQLVFNASHVVVLSVRHDQKPKEQYGAQLDAWRQQGLRYELQEVDAGSSEQVARSVGELYSQIRRRYPEQPVVIDLTPGPKHLSLALLLATEHDPNVHHVYLAHQWSDRTRVPRPSTARYASLKRPTTQHAW